MLRCNQIGGCPRFPQISPDFQIKFQTYYKHGRMKCNGGVNGRLETQQTIDMWHFYYELLLAFKVYMEVNVLRGSLLNITLYLNF